MKPLILQPDLDFKALTRTLSQMGWRRTPSRPSTPSILPGEPEFASWTTKRDKGTIVYTFNPVASLRVLDIGAISAARRPAIIKRLPQLGPDDLPQLLGDPEPRRILLGLLAAELLHVDAVSDLLPPLLEHKESAIADTAKRVFKGLNRTVDPTLEARIALTMTANSAVELLNAIVGDRAMVATLRPTEADTYLVFRAELAPKIIAATDALWATHPPFVEPTPRGVKLETHAATAAMLATPNPVSRMFPSGYRTVSSVLIPDRTWLAWRFYAADYDIRYDGLVWVGERWVWYPKPYRLIKSIERSR